ncbi:transcriptional regulator family: Fungal Specific TF [Penicillium lividum]|nr:transcriptional regulator family: Fungal Specific TF [Penicillium lividum]
MATMEAGKLSYRSQARPACVSCRRRKSRCTIEAQTSICLMCRAHGTECSFPAQKRRKISHRSQKGAAGIGPTATLGTQSKPDVLPFQPASLSCTPYLTGNAVSLNDDWVQDQPSQATPLSLEADDNNPHILGPAAMGDDSIIADYLSSIAGNGGVCEIRPVEPGSSSCPISFTKVQKRPLGMMVNFNPALQKLQVIEKLIEPWSLYLVDMYLDKVNPCCPLLNEKAFREQYINAKDQISPALLSCLYAHMLVFWRYDPKLSQIRSPDPRFIWNLACEALYSELHLSPGISTIIAILLNIGGRPTTSMIGNGIQLGSAVALCHSLGLNRNPRPWDIPQAEKFLRMTIWWSILIQDRWSSLAYGTPPHIRRTQYDVPTPTEEHLLCQRAQKKAHGVFIAFVHLTEVLDYCLEHVYGINLDGRERNLDLELNEWIGTLTGDVRKIVTRGINLEVQGASNLRLGYLAVKLLVRRISLDRERQSPEYDPQHLANQTLDARRAAEDILILVQELEQPQLGDFWLPLAAFTFVSTVTFLIRCALETEQSAGLSGSPSLQMANDLLSSLRSHREKFGWDLADICLAQHSELLEKLQNSQPLNPPLNGSTIQAPQQFTPDMGSIDALFPSIWDTLQDI